MNATSRLMRFNPMFRLGNILLSGLLFAGSAKAQIYVEYQNPAAGGYAIAEYDYSGDEIASGLDASTGQDPIVVSGSDLYELQTAVDGSDFENPTFDSTIDGYNSSGQATSSADIRGLFLGEASAGVGSNLYVTVGEAGGAQGNYGGVAEYTTSGQLVSNPLALGDHDGISAHAIAISGDNMFVSYTNPSYTSGFQGIGEFNATTGQAINANLIANPSAESSSVAVSGGYLYSLTTDADGTGTISKYTTDGTLVSNSLVTGISRAGTLAVSGDDIFVATQNPTTDVGGISEYTTSGAVVNTSLITGLDSPVYVALGPQIAPISPTTKTTLIAAGASYTGVAAVTAQGGLNTTTSIIGGMASSDKSVTISTTDLATQFKTLASDVVSVTGNAGDTFVLQMTFDLTAVNEIGGADAARLLWLNPATGKWENAVLGNTGDSTPLLVMGAYNPSTDFVLGYYGVDTDNDTVWAVINHNSTFVTGDEDILPTEAPEPSCAWMLLGGVGLLAGFRLRRDARAWLD